MQRQIQNLTKENEYLRQGNFTPMVNNGDELLQKKNKEIYDLTVQLGCLKEENHQLKKEQDGF